MVTGIIKVLITAVRFSDAELITEPASVGNSLYLIIGQTVKVKHKDRTLFCKVFEEVSDRGVVSNFPESTPQIENDPRFNGVTELVGRTMFSFSIDNYPEIDKYFPDKVEPSLNAIPLRRVIAIPIKET